MSDIMTGRSVQALQLEIDIKNMVEQREMAQSRVRQITVLRTSINYDFVRANTGILHKTNTRRDLDGIIEKWGRSLNEEHTTIKKLTASIDDARKRLEEIINGGP